MAAATPTDEFYIPADVVKKSNGLAFDIGGSAAKVVYRDKEDWDFEADLPKKVQGDLARVRAATFPMEQRTKMIAHLKQHCHISRSEDQDVVIHSSGKGGNDFGKEFEDELGVKLRNLPQFNTFAKGFHFLAKHTPKHIFLFEVCSSAIEKTKEQVGALLRVTEDSSSTECQLEVIDKENLKEAQCYLDSIATVVQNRPFAEKEDVYPCLLAVLGTVIGYIKLNQDGTFCAIDGSNRAGKMFLGLGSILTGEKSYEELLEMAQDEHSSNVDIYGSDIQQAGEDCTENNLSRSLIHMQCQDLSQLSDLTLETCGIKTVYCCGGFTKTHLVRELMTKEFLQRTLLSGQLGKREMRFIKAGSHIRAFGAFLEGSV